MQLKLDISFFYRKKGCCEIRLIFTGRKPELVEYLQIVGQKSRTFFAGGSFYTLGTTGTLYILLCNVHRHYQTVRRDMFLWWTIFMSLCLVDNALGPCVAGKDERDPGRNREPGSPNWPAKKWALWFQQIGLR